MVDLLADILQNSKLSQDYVDAERSTILKEKKQVEAKEDELLFDHMHAVCYQGHPLSLPILGEERNIKSITRTNLRDYITTHYTAPRMLVIGTGAVDHDQLVKHSEIAFKNLPTTPVSALPPHLLAYHNGTIPVTFHGSEIRVNDVDKPVIHLGIGFESVGWSDPHYFSFLMIQTMIGNWDRNLGSVEHLNSPLAISMASEQLVHRFQSFYTVYNQTGLFGLYLHVPPQSPQALHQVLKSVFNCYKYIYNNLTHEELERAKARVKAQCLMTMDGSSAIADEIGRQILSLGRRLPPEEVFVRIDLIQIEDVRECLKTYFEDVCPTVIALGPTSNLPSYNTIREMTIW